MRSSYFSGLFPFLVAIIAVQALLLEDQQLTFDDVSEPGLVFDGDWTMANPFTQGGDGAANLDDSIGFDTELFGDETTFPALLANVPDDECSSSPSAGMKRLGRRNGVCASIGTVTSYPVEVGGTTEFDRVNCPAPSISINIWFVCNSPEPQDTQPDGIGFTLLRSTRSRLKSLSFFSFFK